MNHELKPQLLEMWEEDCRVREELAATGELFHGYAPSMAEVHNRNAAALQNIIDKFGWPGKSLVGEDGAKAAWYIVQHAIAKPDFQRRCLKLLQLAVEIGEAKPQWAAFLEDRIATFENRPQRFGTQFDWDENGEMSPLPCDDLAVVDARRAAISLEPMAVVSARVRAEVQASQEQAPLNYAERQEEKRNWSKSVGWILDDGDESG